MFCAIASATNSQRTSGRCNSGVVESAPMYSDIGSTTGLPRPVIAKINPACWFNCEISQIGSASIRHILGYVHEHLNDFVHWPKTAVLLWKGCDRSHKYHSYPDEVRRCARALNFKLDGRSNGPAILAFMVAGGARPDRFGTSSHKWSIHHLYFGQFPYIGGEEGDTLHATKDGKHFTQSAGLIAVHPIADALCHEFPSFTWLLRFKSFKKFGYDPDGVFSKRQNQFGFAKGHNCKRVVK